MSTPEDGDRDRGGDPACWMSRVCVDCGRFATEDPPTTCERCGAELPAAP